MTIRTLPTLPTAPVRAGADPDTWEEMVEAWLQAEEEFGNQLNGWAEDVVATVSGTDFNGTSTSSVAIGTGSKSWTTQAGKLWQVGQFVIAADSATPANYCYGQVTAYSGTSLTVNVTATGGSGTITAWAIGLAPAADAYLAKNGGAMTGALTTATPASGQEALIIPPGAAPSSPTNGSVWNTVSGWFARIAGATHEFVFRTLAQTLTNKTIDLGSNTVTGTTAQFNTALSDGDFATLAGSESLSNKTLVDPILTGTARQDIYAIVDGAGFAIDPRNGAWQTITLGASRTPTVANFNAGDEVYLWIDDGSGYSIDWSTINPTWLAGLTPTLRTSGYTRVRLYRIGSTYYGEEVSPTPLTFGIIEVGQTSASGTLSASATTPTISLTSLTGGIGNRPIENDFVVVAVSASSAGGGSDLDITMSSAGWTEDQDLFANSTSDANLAVYYKKMGSSPDTSFQLSIPASANHSYTVGVKVFRGVDTTTPLDVATTTSTGTTTVLVDPPAANAPSSASNLLLLIGGGAHTGGTRTFSASYLSSFLSVGQDNTSGDATLGMGYLKNIYTAYNGAAWTFSTSDNATYSYCAAALVLRAA